MIKRDLSYAVSENENMRGGDGVVTIEHLLSAEELYEKGRLYARISLEPGCSIGYHVHEGEMESFYIISGVAEISDNGEIVTLNKGDSILTRSGEGHSVKSVGNEKLEMLALILHKN